MGLADWTVYRNQAGLQAFIDTATSLVDDGSLEFDNSGLGSVECITNLINLGDSSYTPGLTRGIMRTIIDMTSGNRTRVGFMCMQSSDDMSSFFSSGSAYECAAIMDAGSRHIQLTKYTAGFGASSTLFASSSPAFNFGVPFTLQIEWNVDVPGLGGTRLIVSTGLLFNYSDLAVIHDAVDSTAPLTTSFGEGPTAIKWDTFGDTYNGRIDTTQIFTVS